MTSRRRLPLLSAATFALLATVPAASARALPVVAPSVGAAASVQAVALADTTVDSSRIGAATARVSGAATDYVVVISVDGLRPDAIAKFKAKTISRLLREGSATMTAQTILPSKTLPSHTSMLTGEDVDEHGISWNDNQTSAHGHVQIPTVFALAKQRGFHTAAFFSKGKFNHLEIPGSLDYSQVPAGNGKWSASHTARDVERYLATNSPNLLFVHFGEPDYMGHVFGWMSRLYGYGVRKADAGVARVLAAADRAYGAGNYTVILTADHGGHGRSHGSSDPHDTTIPWITWGKGVEASTTVSDAVRTMDTAGTALWLLGVTAPEGLAGAPVRGAYTGDARTVADRATSREAAASVSLAAGH